MGINIEQGSILDSTADVIVNPANGHLSHSGGLARIIERAATAEWENDSTGFATWEDYHAARRNAVAALIAWDKDHADAPLVATGNAYATSAGRLPFKAIIHAVGPIWNGGKFYERELLNSAHIRAGHVADDLGARSIAFPAISAGIFGFPIDIAAPIAISAADAISYVDIGIDVTFYLPEDAHYAAYAKALRESW